MLILLGLALLFVCGLWLAGGAKFNSTQESVGVGLAFTSATVFVVGMLCLPLQHLVVRADMREFAALQETVERARAAGRVLESAAIQMKVVEANQWLASAQYWNHTLFDTWVPDAVDSLKPIQ